MTRLRFDEVDLLEVGHSIQLAGAVYIGNGKVLLALLPDETGMLSDGVFYDDPGRSETGLEVCSLQMSLSEWQQFLRQTDLLETEVLSKAADGTIEKAIVRKSQRQISQAVSWRVFRRDRMRCRYCAADDIPLTVDHLVLWEEGGPSIEANLVAACRRCNKARGNTPYAEWLEHPHYQRVSKNLDSVTRQANAALVETLGAIPRQVHQPAHR